LNAQVPLSFLIPAAAGAAASFDAHAPELAPYRDEPPQMPSGTVGKAGYLHLGFERRNDRSILARLDRRVPFLVQRALYWDECMPQLPCVFIITTSGCVLQGDRLSLEVELAPGAQAHLTTQAATKIHSMDANYAAQVQTIRADDDSYLEFLPDTIIPHRHSRFHSETRISVAPSATVIYSEILLSGRKHHHIDERFGYDLYSSRVTAQRPDGAPLFTEKLLIEPGRQNMRQVGVMGPFDVFGNVIVLTRKDHADRIYDQLTARVDNDAGIAFGACRLPNDCGLVFKVLGMETQQVKNKIREFWSLTREIVTGASIPREFLWR
jgi:urease accessory protein